MAQVWEENMQLLRDDAVEDEELGGDGGITKEQFLIIEIIRAGVLDRDLCQIIFRNFHKGES